MNEMCVHYNNNIIVKLNFINMYNCYIIDNAVVIIIQ